MRPLWQTLLFFGVATVLWTMLHVYIGRRLVNPTRWTIRTKRIGWGVVMALCFLAPMAMAANRLFADVPAFFRWMGYSLMGLSALLLSFVFIRDLGWWLVRGFDKLALWMNRKRSAPVSTILPNDPSRRNFIFNVTSIGAVTATAGGTALGVYDARKTPDINEVDIPVKGLHPDLDGFTIGQISDVHIGPTISGEDLQGMVAQLNALDVDLIAITGDLVDGFVETMADQIDGVKDLKSKHGSFYCTGNHEYYWDGPAWCEAVAQRGVNVLVNENRIVRHGDAKLLVAGVTDYRGGNRVPGHETDPFKAIEGGEDADFKICLAHQPRSVYEAAEAGFDLQLSGHTHGGQFFPFSLFVGLAHPFSAGLAEYQGMKIFVSTGVGYWGPPMRLGVPAELVKLTLRAV